MGAHLHRFATLQTGEGEQVLQHVVQAVGFDLDTFQSGLRLRIGLPARQSYGDVQARQRRTQLMRDVGQQAALGGDQVFDAFGHAVEVVDEAPISSRRLILAEPARAERSPAASRAAAACRRAMGVVT